MTRVEDIDSACSLGIDAIGMVFYEPSPRAVTFDIAKELTRHVTAFVDTVGLFVNADKGYIREALSESKIDVIQFHGDETPEFCQQFGRPYIKALRVKNSADIQRMVDVHQEADAILLDAYVEGVPGGTGQSFDWNLIPEHLRSKMVLAGGLTPENINSAVLGINPYAVDVSGGIEMAKGVKSFSKMRQFMTEVGRADNSLSEISS
jgi:phosphoribosylanthranilate isomerase